VNRVINIIGLQTDFTEFLILSGFILLINEQNPYRMF